MGAQKETFQGLSGIGDVIVTCLSQHSRNRSVGEKIGQGKKLDEVLNEMQMIAEGVKMAKSVHQLKKKYDIEMPISEAVYRILFENDNAKEAITALMIRGLKPEN
jgi:glycerol-3-phosphate dehydrogenase (NAD(P)+)